MKKKIREKTYHCIIVNPIPFECPKDGKIELVRDGQFVNINMFCFSREKDKVDD